MVYQPLARAVKGVDILLFERLLGYETHVPLLQGGTDCLGIIGIVLLAPDERFYTLRER